MLRYFIKLFGLSERLFKSPDFIIVGAQKSGTTYLYNLLVQHKNILPSKMKEVHFFDNNFDKGKSWYLDHFALNIHNSKITGESSPYYLYHPLAAKRIYNYDKNIKIIILLRNPVDRAISHINMMLKRHNLEYNEDIFCNIDNELMIQTALEEELDKNLIKKNHIHQDFSFIARGIYVNQIKRYLQYFKVNENLLILKSEDFFENTSIELNKIFDFLGVSKGLENIDFGVNAFSADYNTEKYRNCREKLKEFYNDYNNELEKLINQKMNWN